MKRFYVYIMASERNGTLYIGVTSDLVKRVNEHKEKIFPESFTSKYNLDKLIYYEIHEIAESAIQKESQLKSWKRLWKLKLIEENNPDWKDLFETII